MPPPASAPPSTARPRWGPVDEPLRGPGPQRRGPAGPVRDQQRHRPRPSQPGDGHRPAPPGRLRVLVLHPLRRRAGRRSQRLPGRLPVLLPAARLGHRPGLEPAARCDARAGLRGASPRPRRLRRRPPVPGVDPPAQRPRRPAARSGAVARCGGTGPRSRPRSTGSAHSMPCSSPASSPSPPIAGRRSRGAEPRSASGRSSISIRASCSIAGGRRPPSASTRPGGPPWWRWVRAATSTAPSPSRCAPWPRSRTCRSPRCSRASPPTSRSRRASSASMRPSR